MISKNQVLDVLKKGRSEWQAFLSSLSTHKLSEVAKILADLRSDFETAVKRTDEAQSFLVFEIEKRQLAEERTKRKQARAKPKTSLREFLKQPQMEKDIPLKQLSLCTKSGATLALTALTFKVGADGRRVETTNEAKTLFQEGIEVCAPMWDLYYVKDGERTAGFGWERPFLDVVYVI